MAGRSEQQGLLLKQGAGFAIFQNAFDDTTRLVGLIAHRNELRLGARSSFGPQILCEAFPSPYR